MGGWVCWSQLKKVIKRVANELSELGLTSEVLKDLLENGQEAIPPPALSELSPEEAATAVNVTRSGRTTPTPARVQASTSARLSRNGKADGDSSEDEDEAEAYMDGLKKDFKGKGVAKPKAKRKRRAHATYEFAGKHTLGPHATAVVPRSFARAHCILGDRSRRHPRAPRTAHPDRLLFRLVRISL